MSGNLIISSKMLRKVMAVFLQPLRLFFCRRVAHLKCATHKELLWTEKELEWEPKEPDVILFPRKIGSCFAKITHLSRDPSLPNDFDDISCSVVSGTSAQTRVTD